MSTLTLPRLALPGYSYRNTLDLARLYRRSALLLRNEMPLDDLLGQLLQTTPNRRLQQSLQTVRSDLTRGQTLALLKHGFSRYGQCFYEVDGSIFEG
ncbi:hypothetical protein ASF71_20320 [Deinococcus sp. Leaf326]|nr:hypothetical protein ASF71_20320 [Deinococcus sp. Leaf326]